MKVLSCLQIIFLLVCCGCKEKPCQSTKAALPEWQESRGLVTFWPQISKERITSITFCDVSGIPEEVFGSYEQLPELGSFRFLSEKDVSSWPVSFIVPKKDVSECARLIDKAINAALARKIASTINPQGRMKIVTDMKKYIVWVEPEIISAGKSEVLAQDWQSIELGEYLKKCGFPVSK
jgi:hypothetical protein